MKISVIIPMRNEQDTIRGCLESLQLQTVQPDEIVVVDNNSTDKSAEIVRTYAVRLVKEPRAGIWQARATGNTTATGDILVHTDADARFPSDWIEKIREQFVVTDVIAITGPGKFYGGLGFINSVGRYLYMKPYFLFVGSALMSTPLFGSNFAMRRSVWLKVKDEVHIDTTFIHDDIDLSYHILKYGKIKHVKDIENYISIRPFYSVRGMIGRFAKGFKSIFIHLQKQSPPVLLWIKLKQQISLLSRRRKT